YRVTDRLLLRLGLAREADRLRGLTVVVTRDGVVRTVKWDFELRRRGQLRRSRRNPEQGPAWRCEEEASERLAG
ncbi:MAG: hypothetical protein QN144_13990, partial [Armatimonadota bacterium]|nr:hypothetical protein [Armatimonadota bacterium]